MDHIILWLTCISKREIPCSLPHVLARCVKISATGSAEVAAALSHHMFLCYPIFFESLSLISTLCLFSTSTVICHNVYVRPQHCSTSRGEAGHLARCVMTSTKVPLRCQLRLWVPRRAFFVVGGTSTSLYVAINIARSTRITASGGVVLRLLVVLGA